MNKICKTYIRNVKILFPIMGKSERNYINNLQNNLEEYCNEVSISSIDELYSNFGTPKDVLNSYLNCADNDYLINNLHKTRIIKRFLLIGFTIVLSVSIIYSIFLYNEYRTFKEEQAIFIEDEIH